MDDLTEQQRTFVREYLVDRNGKQAAIRAKYSPKTAEAQASRLLSKAKVRDLVNKGLQEMAERTETEAEWVRRRLKEEAENTEPGSSHAARIKALELVGKINGVFELDNRQKTDPLVEMFRQMSGQVVTPSPRIEISEDDDEF